MFNRIGNFLIIVGGLALTFSFWLGIFEYVPALGEWINSAEGEAFLFLPFLISIPLGIICFLLGIFMVSRSSRDR